MDLNQFSSSGQTVRHVKVRYFLIVLVPILIFVINAVITSDMMAADLSIPPDILQTERPWLETAGRYRFLSATWFFGALSVLAVALLVRNLMRPTARDTRAAAIITLGIVLALAVSPTITHMMDPDGPRIYYRLGADFYETALSQGRLPGCNAPGDQWLLGDCGDNPVISLFNSVLDIINILAGLSVGALIVSMILCLETRDGNTVEEDAALQAQNLRQMRQQLYLSSLTLTFGMLFATSWMYWPLPLVQPGEQAAYSSVVLSAALFTGTYFCLLILSFYLPVALILDGRVRKLALRADQSADSSEPLDKEDWRASHGLKEGAVDYMRAGFALTAPILAAFAGGISPISF